MQLINQVRSLRLHQLHLLHILPALVTPPPNPPMLAVAARVAEIHFAVLDDRVAPVRDIKRTVGAELHVDRPERDVRAAHEFILRARLTLPPNPPMLAVAARVAEIHFAELD